MPRRLLSSRLTPFYKFVVPLLFVIWIFWVVTFLITGRDLVVGKVPAAFLLVVAIITAVNFAWMGWLALRSHKVEADAENFYVSNFGKEIVIPRADLYKATEMRWFQPYWITLRLRRPSEFGDRIMFIPPWRFGSFWTANPLVDELNSSRTRW